MFNSQLTTMAAESYERAYGAMVLAQELTELEEAIEYKLIPERRIRILLLWSRRIQGCSRNVDHWRRILLIRYSKIKRTLKNKIMPGLLFYLKMNYDLYGSNLLQYVAEMVNMQVSSSNKGNNSTRLYAVLSCTRRPKITLGSRIRCFP